MEISPTVRRAGIALVAAGAALGGYVACGGGGESPTPPEDGGPSVASVEVTPPSASLTVDQTQQFDAEARDADGDVLSGVSFSWRSTNTSVATVDDQGLATAQAEGQADIVAEAEGVEGSAGVSVSAETQAAASLAKISGDGQHGTTNQAYDGALVVEARDDADDPVENVPVSWSVTSGDATLSTGSTLTGSDGRASVEVTAGPSTGTVTVEASADEGSASPVTYDLDTSVALVLVGDNFFEDPEGRQNGSAAVSIVVGDTVAWEWSGNNSHTVTSDSEPAGGDAFDSGTQTSGTFRFAPGTDGTWEYFCEVHPGIMTGSTIDVSPGG